MAVMRGVNCFLVTRYIVFALFTICNAITCSVAVWNLSVVPHNAQPAQVDIYLIFLGAFSLLSILTLIFTELLCTDPFTTHVWFECAWVTVFWLMELAGGAALIASSSDLSCSTTSQLDAGCISERILLAFTWMCTITLLVYLLVIVVIAASRFVEDYKIWTTDIRILGIRTIRRYPSSPSLPSPLTTRFSFKKRASVDIYSPRPTRPPPVRAFPYVSSEYEIEPFHPVFASPELMDISYPSDLPEALPVPPAPIIPPSAYTKPVPPLPNGARVARSLSLSLRRELPSTVERANSNRPSGPVPGQSTSLPSPSPLGDWPREDVMRLPPKVKRRPLPPSAFEFPKRQLVNVASTDRAPMSVGTISTSVVQPRPRRPSGPRQRVPSGETGHRPAPLNLAGISSHEPGRRADAG